MMKTRAAARSKEKEPGAQKRRNKVQSRYIASSIARRIAHSSIPTSPTAQSESSRTPVAAPATTTATTTATTVAHTPVKDRSQNCVQIHERRVKVNVYNEVIRHNAISNKDLKKAQLLKKLVEFHKEHGDIRIPKDYKDKELYRYSTNIYEAMARKYEYIPQNYHIEKFEQDTLEALGVWYDKETGANIYQKPSDLEKAQTYKALIKAGKAYKKNFNHFRIFEESEDNRDFKTSVFENSTWKDSHIDGLRHVFLSVRRRGDKKLGKQRLECIKKSLGIDIKNTTLHDLGQKEG